MHCNQARHYDNSLSGGGVIEEDNCSDMTGDAILDFANIQACIFGPGKRKGYSSSKVVDRSTKSDKAIMKLPSTLPLELE